MMKKIIVLTLVLSLISGIGVMGQKSIANPLKLNNGPHLFIDDYLIAEQSFLNRVVNNPEKLEKPVLAGGEKPVQVFLPYLSVLHDPQAGKYRLWTGALKESKEKKNYCHTVYTESLDGIHWGRPEILKEPQKVQLNCKVIDRGIDFSDKQKRYVMGVYLFKGLRIFTSPDGFAWSPLSDETVILHSLDINSLHWDPIRNQYIAIVSRWKKGFGDPAYPLVDDTRRIPYESVSNDLVNWEPMWQIFSPNMTPIEKGETQFYGMSGIIARGDLLIGLVKVLRDDLNATYGKDAKGMGELERKAGGIGYTVLAWSHDGRTWERDYEPFIPRNYMPGTFDHAMAWGDEQIIVGDETFIYYGGYERGHKVNRFEERHIGLARMPIDRYVSRDADLINMGTLITKPLIINAESLTVNANVKEMARVRVLDSKHKPLHDYGWINFSGDSIAHKIAWIKSLKNISGKPVCLEFQLKEAQLFGFNLY
ncbi:MAG TPA: hypothetical protein DCY97_16420 [Marinilabiliales bacterium]|nr:hypothetical protein [Marinilabiliales bacterium]